MAENGGWDKQKKYSEILTSVCLQKQLPLGKQKK